MAHQDIPGCSCEFYEYGCRSMRLGTTGCPVHDTDPDDYRDHLTDDDLGVTP